MSLISDALRKARQEAAEREAKERGLETPVVAGYWKRGGRLGAGLVLGAVIALGAAVVGGCLVWWVLADRSDAAAVEAPDREGQAVVEVVETVPAQLNGDQTPDQSVEAMAPAASPGDDVPQIAFEGDTVSGTDAIDRVSEGTEGVPTEFPLPASTSSGDDAGGEFVAEAHIGDITLTLDYLVYRTENPFAQVNGRDVRVGSVIEDFVVEAITTDSVVLTRDQTKIVLRVQ